jgi:hypothetical protein
MDVGERTWATHYILDDLVRRFPQLDVAEARLYLDHDEVGLAVAELLGVLIAERVGLTAEELRRVGEVLTFKGSSTWAARDVDAVLAVLDRAGEPLTHRGLPLLRGGHLPGTGRPGATLFPSGWDEQRIDDAAGRLVGPRMTLANGRTWVDDTVDGIRIGVLRDETGAVRTVAPLPGPDVRRMPEPREAIQTLLAGELRRTANALLTDAAPLLGHGERAALESLRATGEWAELADALIARLSGVADLPEPLAAAARRLLLAFDLPVDGCAYLNDRDRLLARGTR